MFNCFGVSFLVERKSALKLFGLFLILSSTLLCSCNSGKIPCPKVENKQKVALFRKKADPTIPNQEGFGQSKPTEYNKNGLMKKKSYKNLKQKPKRLKSV